MKILLTACLFILMVCSFMLACNATANGPASTVSDTTTTTPAINKTPDTTTLAGGWYLQPVPASDTATGQIPTLRFDLAKTHFSGNTGCNSMSGIFWYSDKDSSLSFSDKFANTKMNCPGYNEKAFITSLMQANHYRLEKGMLILLVDNTVLSRWTRNPPSAPRTGKA